MSRKRELEIHTSVVNGDDDSFKAALNRSMLGVTFKKFKSKGRVFYQNRIYNTLVTQRIYDNIRQVLLQQPYSRNLSDLKVKVDFKPEWDDTGKILQVSDINVSVFVKIGNLTIQELKVKKEIQKIQVDLFYSTIDAASQKVRKILDSIIEELGPDNIGKQEHDFLDPKNDEIKKRYKITTVPTVLIGNTKLENPDERELKSEIELAFNPEVEPININVVAFKLDASLPETVEKLTEAIQKKSK
jgi:hypothetical protein